MRIWLTNDTPDVLAYLQKQNPQSTLTIGDPSRSSLHSVRALKEMGMKGLYEEIPDSFVEELKKVKNDSGTGAKIKAILLARQRYGLSLQAATKLVERI